MCLSNILHSLIPSDVPCDRSMGLGEIAPRGTFKGARLPLNGVGFMAVESALPHPFKFTPSIPFFVDWKSEAEIDSAHGALAIRVEALVALGK